MVEVRVIDVTPRGWGAELIASYLIVSEKTALVDVGPASSVDQLKEALEALGADPDYIVVTHIHLDHAGSVGHLLRDYPSARVIVHPRGAKHLVNPEKLWSAAQTVLGRVAEIYGEPLPAPSDRVVAAEDGYRLDLGGDVALSIHHTPGHASHHQSILLEPDGILFTGDSAGISITVDGKPVELPTTPPPFHPQLYLESLEKMKALKPRKPAPAHYGVKDEDGVRYLEREEDRINRWLSIVREIVSSGTSDVDEVARLLAEREEDARVAFEHPNPIVKEVFYRGTVWGLVEAVKKMI